MFFNDDLYSKMWYYVSRVSPVLSGHFERRPKLVFETDYRLMQVKSIAECSILEFF